MDNIEEFLQSVTVLDVETTGSDTRNDEIVELATCRRWEGEWSAAGMLFGTSRPIPPDACAVHHISNKMIEGMEMFPDVVEDVYQLAFVDDTTYMVAHNSEFDRAMMVTNVMRAMNQEPWAPYAKPKTWICTYRLAKELFADDDTMKFGLGYLRYALDLEVPEGNQAHRAADDTVVCALLLDYLINKGVTDGRIDPNGDIGAQILALCWSPKIITKWPFGKYKGQKLADIPDSYFTWALTAPIDSLDEDHQNYDDDLAQSVIKRMAHVMEG